MLERLFDFLCVFYSPVTLSPSLLHAMLFTHFGGTQETNFLYVTVRWSNKKENVNIFKNICDCFFFQPALVRPTHPSPPPDNHFPWSIEYEVFKK